LHGDPPAHIVEQALVVPAIWAGRAIGCEPGPPRRPISGIGGPGHVLGRETDARLQQRGEPLGVLGVHAKDDPGPPHGSSIE
jgi:hypothetical protein